MSELLNSANLKLARFVLDPKPEGVLTLQEYSILGPYQKGYAAYMMSDWPDSEVPGFNPFKEGTTEFKEFLDGNRAAMMEVQETNG
jgi:hypothetical protein